MNFYEVILFVLLTAYWILATIIRSTAILAEWEAKDGKKGEGRLFPGNGSPTRCGRRTY